jgi:hypothetical protein
MEFSLSLHGLNNVNELPIGAGLKIEVRTHVYSCSVFAATFLSLRVVDIQQSDCLASSIFLDINNSSHQFESMLNLASGLSVSIDVTNAAYDFAIGEQLDNTELMEAARSFYNSKSSINHETVVTRELMGVKYRLNIDTELAFLPAHFSEFSNDSLRQLPVPAFEAVLTHRALQIKSDAQNHPSKNYISWFYSLLIRH